MLRIYWGNEDSFIYGPTWFRYNYEQDWFADPLVQEMMEDIDKSRYLGGDLIRSDILGPIPPERLSGGLKTLIAIYKRSDLHFDATSCGPNCARWLLEIGNRGDVLVELGYIMPFDGLEPFQILIENTGEIVRDMRQLLFAALPFM